MRAAAKVGPNRFILAVAVVVLGQLIAASTDAPSASVSPLRTQVHCGWSASSFQLLPGLRRGDGKPAFLDDALHALLNFFQVFRRKGSTFRSRSKTHQ